LLKGARDDDDVIKSRQFDCPGMFDSGRHAWRVMRRLRLSVMNRLDTPPTSRNGFMEFRYLHDRVTRDLTNLSLVKRRGHDGYVVSMHQSGSHWLLHMLAAAIAEKYELPMQERLQTNILENSGASSTLTNQAGIPRIRQSHQIPNPLITNAFMLRLLRMPNYVLLVRDPRAILVSHYKRFQHRYKISFSDYLHTREGLMRQNGGVGYFDKDIWWGIRFLNSWHAMAEARPQGVHLVRYEDLRADTFGCLRQIVDYMGLPGMSDSLLKLAIERSSKEEMSRKEDPGRLDKVVRPNEENPLALYSEDDKKYFLAMHRRYCKADFGYDLNAGW